jgi:hypothetical protein
MTLTRPWYVRGGCGGSRPHGVARGSGCRMHSGPVSPDAALLEVWNPADASWKGLEQEGVDPALKEGQGPQAHPVMAVGQHEV